MTEIIILVLGISLLLYVLLGGADFGAGIIETFTGRRGIDVISRAIAPVWEANHVWVILAVVILFNGFPTVYTSISTYLHIPILIVLLGIVLRGSAFTFRYYDTIKDKSHTYYTLFFRLSSILTPFFYGIILGAIMLGKIPGDTSTGSFYDVYMAPWLTWFSVSTGIFVTVLFGWLAAVYLIGETKTNDESAVFVRISRVFYLLLIFSGLLVFGASAIYGITFFNEFLQSPISMGCIALASAIIPFMLRAMRKRSATITRLLAGIQTALIIIGWYAIQFPVMVYKANDNDLTIYNSRAPESTMYMLFWALLVGIIIIFPAIGYMLKVFKLNSKKEYK